MYKMGRMRFALQKERGESMAITDGFKATDPEYAGIVEAFLAEAAGDETQSLPARTRYLAIVAALLGCQGIDAFDAVVPEALRAGVTPVELKEVVYQAADYLWPGLGLLPPAVLLALWWGLLTLLRQERG